MKLTMSLSTQEAVKVSILKRKKRKHKDMWGSKMNGVGRTFGEELKYYRKEKKLTQEELGKLLGVSTTSIIKYENGERNPKKDKLKKLEEIFDVDFSWVMVDGLIENDDLDESEIRNLMLEIRLLRKENEDLRARLEQIKKITML